MICDNGEERRVSEWIEKYTGDGKLDLVTGYFTVGVLAYISAKLNETIEHFRFVIGDIVSSEIKEERPVDLLAETITVDAALQLKSLAKRAVKFLRQEKVDVRTMEPNFCHAKAILFRKGASPCPEDYYITGSSNLTEAGIGLKVASNVELNVVGQGTDANCKELCDWFESLWKRKETSTKKTVDGKKVDFKEYLIREIEHLFKEYSPRELYYKTLFELFRDQLLELDSDTDMSRRIGHLQNTKIFQSLYPFQQKGVLSIIKKMQDYSGVILADAVGLGKTWSALAVIKYYELKGYEVILLCPKKLDTNWRRYLRKRGSRFDDDAFDYTIRYHTDLQTSGEDSHLIHRIESSSNHNDGLKLAEYFQSDRPKLFVIDESHNLRNGSSMRYKYLVKQLLQPNEEVKVLLLSATPINNTFKDIRNQFALLVKGENRGFENAPGLEVKNLTSVFSTANRNFKEWAEDPDRSISTLLLKLPKEVMRLMDRLVIARTRRQIEGHSDHLTFPAKLPPDNRFVGTRSIGNFESFADLVSSFPKYFAAYKPAVYVDQEKSVYALDDEKQRDRYLVVMLEILLLKRLESSWIAFRSTLEQVRDVHSRTLNAVRNYADRTGSGDLSAVSSAETLFEGDEELDAMGFDRDYALGKRQIKISDVEANGKLKVFEKHLKADVKALDKLLENLSMLELQVEEERRDGQAGDSRDEKLAILMELIRNKQADTKNNSNSKVVVFTAFKDTAEYLFNQLNARGFERLGFVSGDACRTQDNARRQKNFEPLLERFAPFTKLYMEREWKDFEEPKANSVAEEWQRYLKWRTWVEEEGKPVRWQLENPIDILITTDCLSEGQNLQDCDYLVNYDIHWNPVRVVQRLGRIDRLGSPNTQICGVNFWPTADMDEYLNLQERVENRVVAMAVGGGDVPPLTDHTREMLEDVTFEQKQDSKLLQQMETSWDDVENADQNLSFSDLSLEIFRQDLINELQSSRHEYDGIPLGVYTGFQGTVPSAETGLVALLGYPARKSGISAHYSRRNLVYVSFDGNTITDKPHEVLDLLETHQDQDRFVPSDIDQGNAEAIEGMSSALKKWLAAQTQEGGTAHQQMLDGLMSGDKAVLKQAKSHQSLEAAFDPDNCDLILWFVVSTPAE